MKRTTIKIMMGITILVLIGLVSSAIIVIKGNTPEARKQILADDIQVGYVLEQGDDENCRPSRIVYIEPTFQDNLKDAEREALKERGYTDEQIKAQEELFRLLR